MEPKVFVSHAREDKERFVLGFAAKLRANGIDAWLDKWEMLPGDSLVDKIFEEGIKEAAAVIVVLSSFSVSKPWVREELNAAFVKRINNGSKLIPVVIDECDVPEALRSTLWERVGNLDSYEASLQRIVVAVFGLTDKPPVGSPPKYVGATALTSIGGLNKVDSLVLKTSCECALESGNVWLNPGKLFLVDGQPILPEEELRDSLQILDQQGYIELLRTISSGFSQYKLTTYGLETYARDCIPNYDDKILSVASALVNDQLGDNFSIAKKLNERQLLIDHILDLLESNGHLKHAKMVGGMIRVFNVSASLKRSLANG
jgi:hypothetical protein